jgi:hypothetical protein
MPIEYPALHWGKLKASLLASEAIEELAEKTATNLVRTPENAHRSMWRALVCDRIDTIYPRSIGFICDYHQIGLRASLSAFTRDMPEAKPFLNNIKNEPYVFVDNEGQKSIIYSPIRGASRMAPDELGRENNFRLACMLGHILMHLPNSDLNYIVSQENIPVQCRREAALFGRAIWMPRVDFGAEFDRLVAQRENDFEEKMMRTFIVPDWAIKDRLHELKLVPEQLSFNLHMPETQLGL